VADLPDDLTSLTDLKAREVSLVDRGANKKRRFPVFKENPMDLEMIEILKAVVDVEIDDEAKLTAWIEKEKLSDKEAAALKAAMRLLNGFSENAKIKGLMGKMAGMVGFAKAETPDPDPKPEPAKKPVKKDEPDPKETPVKISAEIQKQLDDANARADKIEKANKALAEQVEVEKKARERAELVAVCKEKYPLIPGLSTEEQADMLLGLDATNRALVEKQWAATADAVEKSALLQSGGSQGAMATAGGAHQKLLEIAKGIVEKSGHDLTPEKAFVKAMDANPELYNEYLADNPKQTGRGS
jgi:hypothetical protein